MDTPKDYLCPITHEVMVLPVILIEDGRSYERAALLRWLQNHNTSPITNKVLKSKDWVVNINLKNAIEEFRDKQFKAAHCETVANTFMVQPGRPSPSSDSQLRIKICLLGDMAVGKTTILKHLQFQDRIQKECYLPTVSPDIISLYLNRRFEDRYLVRIYVYDIPGDVKQSNVWRNQYKCHGAILVCDVTKPETLKNLEQAWLPCLKQHGYNAFESVILCNKIDLADNSEAQIFKDAEHFSLQNDLSLFHTSGITGKNIQAMFNQLVLCILNNTILLKQLKLDNNVHLQGTTKKSKRKKATTITLNTDHGLLSEEKKNSCC